MRLHTCIIGCLAWVVKPAKAAFGPRRVARRGVDGAALGRPPAPRGLLAQRPEPPAFWPGAWGAWP